MSECLLAYHSTKYSTEKNTFDSIGFFLSMNHQHQSKIFKRDLTFHLVKKMCCYISKIFYPTFYFFFWLAFCPTFVTTHKRK